MDIKCQSSMHRFIQFIHIVHLQYVQMCESKSSLINTCLSMPSPNNIMKQYHYVIASFVCLVSHGIPKHPLMLCLSLCLALVWSKTNSSICSPDGHVALNWQRFKWVHTLTGSSHNSHPAVMLRGHEPLTLHLLLSSHFLPLNKSKYSFLESDKTNTCKACRV